MLYVFAGFPKCGLHAGGIRLLTHIEELGILEETPGVQLRKEGVYVGEEWSRPVEYCMSARCERDGITWAWFPENWAFGNGVTVHKTTAEYRKHLVILKDNSLALTVDDRSAYEARWVPGTCPRESHVVHLTWLVTTHELPPFAYERLRALIEDGATPLSPEVYEDEAEPGKYQTVARPLTFRKGNEPVGVAK